MAKNNPYLWTGDHQPYHVVERRELLLSVLKSTRGGKGSVLLGARGMGKSVFLSRLFDTLRSERTVDALLFSAPPATKTLARAFTALAEGLARRGARRMLNPKVAGDFAAKIHHHAAREDPREMFDLYLSEFPSEVQRLVLLYDELDAYARPANFGSDFFDALEAACKELKGQVVVVAAGGLGLLVLKTVFGSSFFTRKNGRILEPFGISELEELAEPFAERGAPLPPELIDEVRLASGGNVALATYGFQELWDLEAPRPEDAQKAFRDLREHSDDILDSIWEAIFDLDVSEIPFHVWQALQRGGGILRRAEMARLRRESKTTFALTDKKIFDMLRASGLVRMESSVWDVGVDPIVVECVPSILSLRPFDEEIEAAKSLQEQLIVDLRAVLVRVHSMTLAFYRPAMNEATPEGDESKAKTKKKAEEKHLVPEATFAAGIVLGLDPRG